MEAPESLLELVTVAHGGNAPFIGIKRDFTKAKNINKLTDEYAELQYSKVKSCAC